MMNRHLLTTLCAGLSIVSSITSVNVHAMLDQEGRPLAKWQASVYLGGTSSIIRPQHLYLINETDTLVPNQHNQNNFSLGLGLGYRFAPIAIMQYYSVYDVALGLDFFHLNTEQKGTVWQFDDPELDNFSYRLPIKSNRYMADAEFTLKPFCRNIFPFLAGGIGVAANKVGLHEMPVPTYLNPGLDISDHTEYQFAYSLSGGLKMALNKNLDLSVRYTYANLGKIESGLSSDIPLATRLAATFYTQSLLAGLTYAFD